MNDLKVNATGSAQVSIGNVVQGTNASVTAPTTVNASYRAVLSQLSDAVRDAATGDGTRVSALQPHVEGIAGAIAEEDSGRLSAALTVIKEHHDWAFPAITAIVQTVAPKLLALI